MKKSSTAALAAIAAWVLLPGCCGKNAEYARPSGAAGAFVRAIPSDGPQPLDAQAGEGAPPQSWPPKPLYAPGTPEHDELVDLEKSLGVTSVGCPAQYMPAPAVGGAAPATSFGFNVHCYPLG